MKKRGLAWCLAAMLATAVAAQELKAVIVLPAPQTDGGRPLMQALKERKSTREFSGEKLPVQVLAQLVHFRVKSLVFSLTFCHPSPVFSCT